MFDAVTTIGEVGWAINKPVLEVVERAWAAQMPICNLPVNRENHRLRHQTKPTTKRFRTDSQRGQLQLMVSPACF